MSVVKKFFFQGVLYGDGKKCISPLISRGIPLKYKVVYWLKNTTLSVSLLPQGWGLIRGQGRGESVNWLTSPLDSFSTPNNSL
jgi:hypothetical protein